jgi:hypothetical protein
MIDISLSREFHRTTSRIITPPSTTSTFQALCSINDSKPPAAADVELLVLVSVRLSVVVVIVVSTSFSNKAVTPGGDIVTVAVTGGLYTVNRQSGNGSP